MTNGLPFMPVPGYGCYFYVNRYFFWKIFINECGSVQPSLSQPFEIQDLQVHWMKHSELHYFHPTTSHVTLLNACHVLLTKALQSSTCHIRSSTVNPPRIIHTTHVHVLLTTFIYFTDDNRRFCVCCVVRRLPPRSLTLRPSKKPSCSEFLKARLHSQQPAANPRFHRIATTTTTYLTLTCLASSHILTQLFWHPRQGHRATSFSSVLEREREREPRFWICSCEVD